MSLLRCVLIFTTVAVSSGCATACGLFGCGDGPNINLRTLNASIQGRVDDYTHNHGADQRFHSDALGTKRDLYVYVPPGYDPRQAYPMIIWLHGLAQDEKAFLEMVPTLDRSMVEGRLPKCIFVAPDGSPEGRASYFDPGTFYLNSKLGRYEDYVTFDVWNYVVQRYTVRPEREAHGLAGASMGGFAAYNLGIKHRKDFGLCIGIMPAINTRYADCKGNSRTDFDPTCFGLSDRYRPMEPVARFYGGLITIRQRRIVGPVFGEGPDIINRIAAENPAEMLTSYDVKPGELEMFAGYGEFDEFNFDAQVESFAFLAQHRGLQVHTFKVPGGRHNRETGFQMLENFNDWIRIRFDKYSPK